MGFNHAEITVGRQEKTEIVTTTGVDHPRMIGVGSAHHQTVTIVDITRVLVTTVIVKAKGITTITMDMETNEIAAAIILLAVKVNEMTMADEDVPPVRHHETAVMSGNEERNITDMKGHIATTTANERGMPMTRKGGIAQVIVTMKMIVGVVIRARMTTQDIEKAVMIITGDAMTTTKTGENTAIASTIVITVMINEEKRKSTATNIDTENEKKSTEGVAAGAKNNDS